MAERIKEIVEQSACEEEIIVTVIEKFDDAGVNYLFENGIID